MPQNDLYHDVVVKALESEGWTITDDPLSLSYGNRKFYVDLGAENLLGAVKGSQRIAVEIKSFAGLSEMRDLEAAIGQYIVYRDVLEELQPDRVLYLAVPDYVYDSVFEERIGQLVTKRHQVKLLVFKKTEEKLKWIQ